jgi:phenylpyruvate tautomerase PptA (4-oxalocrotonate tautomerase family)
MPTYYCVSPSGLLAADQKQKIAQEITRIHNAVTGAASFFAQVVFTEIADGDYFIGGKRLASDQFFVHGHIRAGRSALDRQRLVAELVDALSATAALPKRAVWVYIAELPARQMAEYGHVLPEPGDESAWLQSLPAEDRDFMLGIG